MNEKTIIIIAIIILFGVIIFFLFKRNRCPICNKFFTIHSTGRTKLETYTKKESEYIPEKRITKHHTYTYQKYKIHYKCSNCDYTFDENSDQVIDRKTSI